ncbi:MAG: hypothetical protein J6X17_10480, partial [Lachnospiraceae bacterium]|nr:hypothetical protein [Lachnospiraceae bacterium]
MMKRRTLIFLCIVMMLAGAFASARPAYAAETEMKASSIVSAGKKSKKKAGIKINKAHFPDKRFRKYVRKAFDDDGNGYLSDAEIDLIWNVHCENMK